MDSIDFSDDGDWVERKEAEKDERYALQRYFTNLMSAQKGKGWDCTQINFTVGARGSLKHSSSKTDSPSWESRARKRGIRFATSWLIKP